jgi:hypothetical protein
VGFIIGFQTVDKPEEKFACLKNPSNELEQNFIHGLTMHSGLSYQDSIKVIRNRPQRIFSKV